ncbi:hypothetical protein FIBSPDRAFT_954322 [Athelia psychrophila]|uniref:GST C-terminal domain-containing protein n=1 Tax=Athelia psychrophila TaxID=1759441 RepID=A0A166J8U0_9AGAM|nr:hypothetical protein FIBSPDRAFT_954322 [Fibularhizoctonia sp. CBS 109695]
MAMASSSTRAELLGTTSPPMVSEQVSFDAVAYVLSYEKWFKKMIAQEPDEAVVEVTLADLFHLPYGAKVKEIFPGLFSSRPHVAKWFESLEGRPSWQAVKDRITSWT